MRGIAYILATAGLVGAALAVEVLGQADEAPGDLADERLPARDDAQVGPAVLERDAQRLALAAGDVRAGLTGRGQHGERDGLDRGAHGGIPFHAGPAGKADGQRRQSGLCYPAYRLGHVPPGKG